MKRFAHLALFVILLLTVLPLYGTGRKVTPIRRVTELFKFGATEIEVLGKIPGNVSVVEIAEPLVNIICSYDYMRKILQPGIMPSGENTILYPALTKRYEINGVSDTWPGITSVRLLFYRTNEAETTYRLFLILSMGNVEVSDLHTAFMKYVDFGIKNRKGKTPELLNTTYTNSTQPTPIQANMAIWSNDSIFETLAMMDNGSFIFPEFIYYSKKELNGYLKAVAAYNRMHNRTAPPATKQQATSATKQTENKKMIENQSIAKKQSTAGAGKKKAFGGGKDAPTYD